MMKCPWDPAKGRRFVPRQERRRRARARRELGLKNVCSVGCCQRITRKMKNKDVGSVVMSTTR